MIRRTVPPPCPLCGRKYDFQHCWTDLAHGAYYAALRTGNDAEQLAAALQVEKPEPVPDGQLSLFGESV